MDSRHEDWVPPESFDEYRLVQALGRGSMGQVWLAHDTVLDRLVAVKFITELPGHDTAHRRFLAEARAAARVQHPNIIAVYRVGEIGSRPYLISEYVRGESLDQVARPVAWPRLREVAIGLARGLAAAHRQGVLHCDLKPANVIVSETGEVKLLDFGLARLIPHGTPPYAAERRTGEVAGARLELPGEPTIEPAAGPDVLVRPGEPHATTAEAASGEASGALSRGPGGGIAVRPSPAIDLVPPILASASPSVSRSSAVTGTPVYLAPEAWRGEPATPRSDVYSLGAVLYTLGAGTPPCQEDSSQAARQAAVTRDPPSLAVTVPGIDPGFAEIVDRCLKRDPAERFASGEAVLAALAALSTGDRIAPGVRARPRHERSSSGLRWTVAAGAGLALALAWFAYHGLGGEPSGHHAGIAPPGCSGEMVPVPAGTFRMGSLEGDADEQPEHEVTLSAYCIDRTEVTVAAYAACVAAGGCSAASLTVNWNTYTADVAKRLSRWCTWMDHPDHPDHPINCVDWGQAAAYCAWKGKRLPTEAEWEYAARGDDGRAYPWGNEAPSPRRLNACGTECVTVLDRSGLPGQLPLYDADDGWGMTAPVGSYPEGRSPFGALDMAGNVAEWTAAWYEPYTKQAAQDPRGPSTGTSRVVRGGGCGENTASKFRAADRDWPDPTLRRHDLGFRCARGR